MYFYIFSWIIRLYYIYYKNNDFDNSLKFFEQLKEVNPEHEGAFYMAGMVYKSLGDEEKCVINLETAAELGSTEAKDLLNKIEQGK